MVYDLTSHKTFYQSCNTRNEISSCGRILKSNQKAITYHNQETILPVGISCLAVPCCNLQDLGLGNPVDVFAPSKVFIALF